VARAKSLSEPVITPIRHDNPAGGFVLSVLFHACIIGAFWLSWPFLRHETPIEPPLIVDLVPIDEITAAPPKPPEQQPQPETPPEPPKPVAQQTPPPIQEQPLPQPEMPPPPKPQDVQMPPPPPVVKPPPPKPEPPKPKKNDMQQLEKLLQDIEKKQPQKQQAPAAPPSPATNTNNEAPSTSDRATMTELDAIRHHFEDCWRIDPGKEGIENLAVDIHVFITPDGNVQRADILDMTRYFTDAPFRTFANSARIAVLGCSGVPISPDHYEELKEMTLHFSPQGRIN
jgi:outer membrane biosynthesis protein TonB